MIKKLQELQENPTKVLRGGGSSDGG
jgi:hypothetical protein